MIYFSVRAFLFHFFADYEQLSKSKNENVNFMELTDFKQNKRNMNWGYRLAMCNDFSIGVDFIEGSTSSSISVYLSGPASFPYNLPTRSPQIMSSSSVSKAPVSSSQCRTQKSPVKKNTHYYVRQEKRREGCCAKHRLESLMLSVVEQGGSFRVKRMGDFSLNMAYQSNHRI